MHETFYAYIIIFFVVRNIFYIFNDPRSAPLIIAMFIYEFVMIVIVYSVER